MNSTELASVRQRISDVENQLQVTLGYLKALEAGLRLSIATHGDLNTLLAALDVFEEGLPTDPAHPADHDLPIRHRALHEVLGAIRQQILQLQQAKPPVR